MVPIDGAYLSPVDIEISVQVHSITTAAWSAVLPPKPCIGPGVLMIISFQRDAILNFIKPIDQF
jgi:hypothetical protein